MNKASEEHFMTVHEVSELTGVSIRTLHYYDEIGLLHPSVTTEAGYRLYDDTSLERLQDILLFRELEFPLKEIRKIMSDPKFDRRQALEDQIQLLKLKREHLDQLIKFAKKVKEKGDQTMSFEAFDTSKIEAYKKDAKERWGATEAYKEFEARDAGYTDTDRKKMGKAMMELFHEFGGMMDQDPSASAVQTQVKKLQDFITKHYYTCTNQILGGLGQMYAAGGEMTENIDAAGGKGCAEFAAKAIEIYCK